MGTDRGFRGIRLLLLLLGPAGFLFLLGAITGFPGGAGAASWWIRDLALIRRAGLPDAGHESGRPGPGPPVVARYPLARWRVGLQAGHWKIEELPDELHRLRSSTGARYGAYSEVDLNLDIARRVAAYLEAAGIQVDLLPATVPPGYQADAFLAIHADGAARPSARGWKAATPWLSSPASRALRDAVGRSYALFTGLPEDRYGTTYNMRGYYAFSSQRFSHAITRTTPAIIIETGFVTVKEDRELLFGSPDVAARGISAGVIRFLSEHDPLDPAAVQVRSYPAMRVVAEQTALTFHPEEQARIAATLPAGTLVRPVHRENGWVEVVVWGNYRRFGWVRERDLDPPPGSS